MTGRSSNPGLSEIYQTHSHQLRGLPASCTVGFQGAKMAGAWRSSTAEVECACRCISNSAQCPFGT